MKRMSVVRHLLRLLSVIGCLALALRTSALDFARHPELAGKVPLTGQGYVVIRDLGAAAFAPSLTFPIQLAYRSVSESSGILGYGWRIPQLESSIKWDLDGALWIAPWGERVKFFPQKSGGRTLASRASDWWAEASASDPATARRFTVSGKNVLRGWSFLYEDSLLREIHTPDGSVASISYDAKKRPVSVSASGIPFVQIAYNKDGLVTSLTLNGVRHELSRIIREISILPKTLEGQVSKRRVALLSSVKSPMVAPLLFDYDKAGYLTSIRQGAYSETLKVECETPAERQVNILAAESKGKTKHSGKIAGRLLADGDYRYSYPGKNIVALTDATNRSAEVGFDALRGILRRKRFDGRRTTTYYHMRWDAAYLGKVRLIEDGRGRELARFRFDRNTGLPTRVTDALGNLRYFEYDNDGNCTKVLRRSGWLSGKEPVRSYEHDAAGRTTAVSGLDAAGCAVWTVSVVYDRRGRPVRVSNGRRKIEVAYAPNGFPSSLSDDCGMRLRIVYDRFNRPISMFDADEIETRLAYNAAGRLSRLERRDRSAILSAVSVAYDECGRPVSMTDDEGRTSSCDRDSLGRLVRERCSDGAVVSYMHDALGRLSKVVDENGHEISFSWDSFGLSSRRTAEGQLTEFARDGNGLVSSVAFSKNGKTERIIRREHDAFDRIVSIEYAKGETETFAYDRWGRISERTLGKARETYVYDHFGRITERRSGDLVYRYAYDSYGSRTALSVTDGKGKTVVSERRAYDKYGRLVEISSFGKSVKFTYDRHGRLSRQTIDGTVVDYDWTRSGQLATKWFGGRRDHIASVEYEYSRGGRIAARTANGIRQEYEYDGRGQLLSVREGGKDVERYVYDKVGNILRKTVRGKTTSYAYDGANQLVSSECGGVKTRYVYDAAGRLVREGGRVYGYGYLDKVLSVSENGKTCAYAYHPSGHLAFAGRPDGTVEDFLWDGLALVKRGKERLVNEPHTGGGAPVLSSSGAVYFNDLLGTTLGMKTKGCKYAAARQTPFGDVDAAYFTGKPLVASLGRVFLFRNYRPDLAQWQTSDPFGYPDGWNQLSYCCNDVMSFVDFLGARKTQVVRFETLQSFSPSFVVIPWYNSEWDAFGLAKKEALDAGKSLEKWVNDKLKGYIKNNDANVDAFMTAVVVYFSGIQGGPYHEIPPGDDEDPWKSLLEKMESEGWTLESGPQHAGLSVNPDDQEVNAGIGALIIEGCTHHWSAQFVKE